MDSMELLGLAHVGLYVEDAAATVQFYCDVLDFELIHEAVNTSPDGDIYMKFIQNHNLVIEVVQFPNGTKRGDGWFDHVSIAVKDIDHVMEVLEGRGITFEEGSYTVAPHVFPPAGSKWVFFRGPNGEHIELTERM